MGYLDLLPSNLVMLLLIDDNSAGGFTPHSALVSALFLANVSLEVALHRVSPAFGMPHGIHRVQVSARYKHSLVSMFLPAKNGPPGMWKEKLHFHVAPDPDPLGMQLRSRLQRQS